MSTIESHPPPGADSSLADATTGAVIAPMIRTDLPAVARLHADLFGPGRFARTAYRVRQDAPVLSQACHTLWIDGVVQGAVQMTRIRTGIASDTGMLLGPLVVATAHKNDGHGQALIAAALKQAKAISMSYVMLIGDLPYYERSGFQRVPPGRVTLPGPVDKARLLIRMLDPGGEMPSGLVAAVRSV